MFLYGIMVEDIVEAFDMRGFHAKKGIGTIFSKLFYQPAKTVKKCEMTAAKYPT